MIRSMGLSAESFLALRGMHKGSSCMQGRSEESKDPPWCKKRRARACLEHHTSNSTIELGETHERTMEHYGRWHHPLSPPPQFKHGTEVEGNFLRFPDVVVPIEVQMIENELRQIPPS
ncbi:hypothetical protein TNCV_3828141 [Trichonephila clavipes]|nr:hypothetical protein TNCV_3828141 [Trichonephila clavipes]